MIKDFRPSKFEDVVEQKYPKAILRKIVSDPDNSPHSIILSGAFGCGKAQPIHSIVYDSNGPRTIGSLSVGDSIYGSDGELHSVLGIYPQGMRPSCEVSFDDGSIVKCDVEHLWTVNKVAIDSVDTSLVTTTTAELKKLLSSGKHRLRIPSHKAVNYPEASLPIDPYLYGLISCSAAIKSGVELGLFVCGSKYMDRLSYLASEGGLLLEECRGALSSNYCLVDSNTERDLFRTLNFVGKACGARGIYKPYLYGSIEQRLSLLRGVMDSHGEFCWDDSVRHSGRYLIDCPTLGLANDILDLVRSLGGYARISGERYGSRRVMFWITGFDVYPLSDVSFGFRSSKLSNRHKSIVSIKDFPSRRDCVCIKMDCKDELYLTDSYTLTHNTTLARIFAREVNRDLISDELLDTDTVGGLYFEVDSSTAGGKEWMENAKQLLFRDPPVGYKVIVFDEAHLITRHGQAALLKTLEDCGKKLFFVFATTDLKNLTPTIQSRSIQLTLDTVSDTSVFDSVREQASRRDIEISDSDIDTIVVNSMGHMRNAHQALELFSMYPDLYREFNKDISGDIRRLLLSFVLKRSHASASISAFESCIESFRCVSLVVVKSVLFRELLSVLKLANDPDKARLPMEAYRGLPASVFLPLSKLFLTPSFMDSFSHQVLFEGVLRYLYSVS